MAVPSYHQSREICDNVHRLVRIVCFGLGHGWVRGVTSLFLRGWEEVVVVEGGRAGQDLHTQPGPCSRRPDFVIHDDIPSAAGRERVEIRIE